MIEWLDVRKDFEWKMKAVIDGTSHEDMETNAQVNRLQRMVYANMSTHNLTKKSIPQ